MTRLNPGTPVVRCGFCGAVAQQQLQGSLCRVCEIAELGARVSKGETKIPLSNYTWHLDRHCLVSCFDIKLRTQLHALRGGMSSRCLFTMFFCCCSQVVGIQFLPVV